MAVGPWFVALKVHRLEMYFHRPRRTGRDTCPAGDAFLVIEYYQSSFGIRTERPGRADGDTGTATGTLFFVSDNILA